MTTQTVPTIDTAIPSGDLAVYVGSAGVLVPRLNGALVRVDPCDCPESYCGDRYTATPLAWEGDPTRYPLLHVARTDLIHPAPRSR